MDHSAALTVALALAAGVIVQGIAIHLNVPGIALLLVSGVVLGPEVAGLIDPGALGPALHTIVGFSVAVILFEGGMNLNLRRLKREQVVIRRLVTWGGLITAVCAALLALAVLGWPLRTSILFGTLVVVTGPTVVTPLLRRIRVSRHLSTILEAEGVIIDAIGALLAVVALEIAIDPSTHSLALGAGSLLARFGVGVALGLIGGGAIALLLRLDHVVPDRLENVTSLGLALATFQLSNAIISESGIVAAIVAGGLVGHLETRAHRELREFKEQLTVMLIGMLFTLLAASVRWQDVKALGIPALLVVLALMLIVRPLAVAVCTRGTDLTLRERLFMAWLAPRGIIAAAVASLFAESLAQSRLPGGESLRAMVFVVIAATVLLQGLPAGLVARALGVRQPADTGYVIVGANALSRLVGRVLRELGEEVLFIDADPEVCRVAEERGFKVIYGSALEDRTLQRASLQSRRGFLSLTKNEGVNLLCAAKARSDYQVRHAYAGLDRRRIGVSANSAGELGVRTVFGLPRDLRHWVGLSERGAVVIERWAWSGKSAPADIRGGDEHPGDNKALFVPLVVRRRGKPILVDEKWVPKRQDQIWLLVAEGRQTEANRWLQSIGWQPLPGADQPPEAEQEQSAS